MPILKNKISCGVVCLPLPKIPVGSSHWPVLSLKLCLGFVHEGLAGLWKLCLCVYQKLTLQMVVGYSLSPSLLVEVQLMY